MPASDVHFSSTNCIQLHLVGEELGGIVAFLLGFGDSLVDDRCRRLGGNELIEAERFLIVKLLCNSLCYVFSLLTWLGQVGQIFEIAIGTVNGFDFSILFSIIV